MDPKDERLATANAILETNNSLSKTVQMLDRVRIEIREGEAAADERERMYIDDQRKLYVAIGGMANDISELKAAKSSAEGWRNAVATMPLPRLVLLMVFFLLLVAVGGGAILKHFL